jgi:Fur family ferric uptake transcriptional regulator
MGVQEILKQHGLRVTKPRQAIFEVFSAGCDLYRAEDVYERLRTSAHPADLVTIYRTLELFEKLGLIRRVHASINDAVVYERADHHHHHMVCSGCGYVEPFSPSWCDIHLKKAMDEAQKNSEFFSELSGHSLEFSGRCKSCG